MKKLEFLMDDSSIRNDEFAVENNIEKLTNSMYFSQESSVDTYTYELGNTVLSDQIII